MGKVEEMDPLPATSGKSVNIKKKPRTTFMDLLRLVTSANPAALRELFGSWWDFMYGALVVYTLCFGYNGIDIPYPWREISVLIAMFADLVVAIDTSVSVFIRLAQIARVISGRSPSFLSAFASVLFNLIGLLADSIACLPYVILVQGLRGLELSMRYKSIAVIRMTRLLAPSRVVLPKNLKELTFRRLRRSDQYLRKQCEINQEEAFKKFSEDWDEMERYERLKRRSKTD